FNNIAVFNIFGVQFVPKIIKCRNHILGIVWKRKYCGFIVLFIVYGGFVCGMVKLYLDIFGIAAFINFPDKTVWNILFLVNIGLIIVSNLKNPFSHSHGFAKTAHSENLLSIYSCVFHIQCCITSGYKTIMNPKFEIFTIAISPFLGSNKKNIAKKKQ